MRSTSFWIVGSDVWMCRMILRMAVTSFLVMFIGCPFLSPLGLLLGGPVRTFTGKGRPRCGSNRAG